jgi:hypothetical protein
MVNVAGWKIFPVWQFSHAHAVFPDIEIKKKIFPAEA